MTDKEYDVVIVGAGISGAVVAKTLSHAGYSVLILEAGHKTHQISIQDGRIIREEAAI